jgi:probable H4MPT-linked C1 transfer pathway protein
VNGVIGWDIGGVNTKVARVSNGRIQDVRSRPYAVQHAPAALVPLLRDLAVEVAPEGTGDPAAHALTMTAELSQMFRTKREGVRFVIDAAEAALPSAEIHVLTVEGRFLSPNEARDRPLAVAAANWAATSHAVAARHPEALLIDTGTTTTDIIPIVGGAVVAMGRTDPERLASGELVYCGVVRTPTEAIATTVPLAGMPTGVSAEGFALAADVHLWRGDLTPSDYTVPTPDGRAATREFAAERLARVVCADRELLDDRMVSTIADALHAAQVAKVARAIRRVRTRHPSLRTAVVTGLGAFLAEAAAHAAGLDVVRLGDELGAEAARCAPAAAVALLLEQRLAASEPPVDLVVKLGGGILAHADYLEAALAAIDSAATLRRLLIVPGGGPFADAVREVDRRLGLSEDAAHWMAILAMDQHAHLLAARLRRGVTAARPADVVAALAAGRVPVLAPSRWLQETDPLPHSWDVTSDSIAAWITGAIGARALVLIKPPGVQLPGRAATELHSADGGVVDAYFRRALPAHVASTVVPADRIDAIRSALRG